jgi:hypothetical protein
MCGGRIIIAVLLVAIVSTPEKKCNGMKAVDGSRMHYAKSCACWNTLVFRNGIKYIDSPIDWVNE